jgi:catecholate siderophore receptor
VPTTNLVSPNENQFFSFTGRRTVVEDARDRRLGGRSSRSTRSSLPQHGADGRRPASTASTPLHQRGRAGVSLDRADEMRQLRAAIVYKPVPIGSVYFSTGTSFNPSAEA